MLSIWHRYQRILYVLVVSLLVVGTYVPIFGNSVAFAATTTELEPRSIKMSDSGPSGNASIPTGVGSGTNVSYKVSISNVDAFSSLVINFCDNSPLAGDTCLNTTTFPGETSPGNMSVSSATVTAISTTCSSGNEVGGAGWTISTPNAYTVELSSGGANPICAGTSGSPQTQVFSINNITNPDLAESFYGRVYTYSSNSPGTATPTAYSSATAPGSFVDFGGIALSTVQVIQISAKVEESLEFCVSGWAPTTTQYVPPNGGAGADPNAAWSPGDCSSPQASQSPALTIGTLVNGNTVLTPESLYDAADYFQLSTNASNGAVIAMHSSNTCGGLSVNGGTDNCPIKAIGDYSGTSPAQTGYYDMNTAATNDVALFGMQLGQYVVGTSGSQNGLGSLTDTSTYSSANGTTDYGLDDSATTGVAGTYGNTIATTSGPCFLIDDHITFGATSSFTTPAGVYTTNVSLIATGNF